ncbi:MAG: proline--tRNA ligase [Candidatus Wallbacteria bacterium]|nr:proline--tRNA ligase [Candidatus Wallbacteria bacterium]
MRMSQLVGKRYKERPNEASLESHAFLLRGGYIRQLANGIFSLLPPGVRVVSKIEGIIREEMNRINGQEVQMPVVQTKNLWDESGRYTEIDETLVRFNDRNGQELVLAMTHEEAVLHLFRNEVTSYRDLPFMVYQIQTKFRDEIRSRGGLIRVREFTMKDGYSFHRTQEDLERYYTECMKAYRRIFARVGIPEAVMVRSDSGFMGGKIAHEFMLLTEVGEDSLVYCSKCGTYANAEVAEVKIEPYVEIQEGLQKVHTPSTATIEEVAEFLKITPKQTAKVVFYESDINGKPVMAVIRGDLEINEAKLEHFIGVMPQKACEKSIERTGAVPGFASPLGLSHMNVRVLIDHSIRTSSNLVCGANERDYHYLNFNLERDLPGTTTIDIARVREGDHCQCGGKIELKRGIELGNIFQLGTKYTGKMGMRYLDENGQEGTPIMGCYGIGIGRLMASVIEARRDENGPIWPISIAPWQVHINAVKITDKEVADAAEELYSDLQDAGIEVLYDDRNERPGVQFAEADLLGTPFRFIVAEKNLKNHEVEWKCRETGETGKVLLENAVAFIRHRIGMAVNKIEAEADKIII